MTSSFYGMSAGSFPLRERVFKDTEIINRHDFGFASDVIGHLMPFCILVDAKGYIRFVGPALSKLLGADNLIDRPFLDAVDIVKPQRIHPSKGLQDCLGKRLTVAFRHLDPALANRISGMAFSTEYAGKRHVLLTLTPGINARHIIENHGLKLSDFGPVDGSAALLPQLAMQEDLLKDSKRRSARLLVARNAAERLANHDALTGLPNRRALMHRLNNALRLCPLSVVHIDLDKFKEINDTYGHAAGDAALKHATAALTSVFGKDALCARLGGDEFVGVLKGAISENSLRIWAQTLICKISEAFDFGGESLSISASVGLALATPADEMTADTVLCHADLALYEAKRVGRGTARLCTPALLQAQIGFQQLSADIRRGLVAGEFLAYLQPQIEGHSGAVVGMEALVRWDHPQHGLLSPCRFLAQAERAGLIQQIDAEVRRSALDTLVLADKTGNSAPKVSLNVTNIDLIDEKFQDVLLWELDSRDLDPSRVVIEIVESVFFDANSTQITQACQTLVQSGFALSLDDFGTGHASALSLVNLPLSIVKIDRAFAAGVAQDERRKAMAKSLVGMANTVGLRTIAEGVDGEHDVAVFQKMGCEHFQSFSFGRPMSRDALFTWMKGRLIGDCPTSALTLKNDNHRSKSA